MEDATPTQNPEPILRENTNGPPLSLQELDVFLQISQEGVMQEYDVIGEILVVWNLSTKQPEKEALHHFNHLEVQIQT